MLMVLEYILMSDIHLLSEVAEKLLTWICRHLVWRYDFYDRSRANNHINT